MTSIHSHITEGFRVMSGFRVMRGWLIEGFRVMIGIDTIVGPNAKEQPVVA